MRDIRLLPPEEFPNLLIRVACPDNTERKTDLLPRRERLHLRIGALVRHYLVPRRLQQRYFLLHHGILTAVLHVLIVTYEDLHLRAALTSFALTASRTPSEKRSTIAASV